MVDKGMCGTTEHVILDEDLKKGRTGTVSLLKVFRQAGIGMVLTTGLAVALFVLVGILPGIGLLAFAAMGVLLAWSIFILKGHKPGCAVKKALVTFFGWMEFAF
ncbi:hypothetical protein ACFC26_12820 [Kitasatospora purpeofusca]|uniref:hypothetical protein n=1 Tax=Kitasatospora purpeofusca TaxID=67352 RepID=UPI0035D7EE72